MRKSISMLVLGLVMLSACDKKSVDASLDLVVTNPKDKKLVIINADITTNTTFKENEVYLLKKFIYVQAGVTLTIEPGTVIKGDSDSKGTLIVLPGGKIIAEGTPERPIVFTSNKAKGERSYGDWGGLVLMGKAPVNQPNALPEGGISGTFGGTDVNDNSGVLQYVRVEFGGIALGGSNSEINGITFYGVGAGTKVENVQVSYSGDDSFEWFGGTVNCKNLVAHRGWDDDWDTDWGFSGKIQYAYALRDLNYSDQSGSNSFESDNDKDGSDNLPLTSPIFANITTLVAADASLIPLVSKGSGTFQSGMHIRRNSHLKVYNSVIVGHPEGLRLDGSKCYANAMTDKLANMGLILVGNTKPYLANNNKDANGKELFTTNDVKTWFETAKFSNMLSDASKIGFTNAHFSLTSPTILNSNATLQSNAVTINDTFFDKTSFKGAFGDKDWTKTWTNFDPQNTDY